MKLSEVIHRLNIKNNISKDFQNIDIEGIADSSKDVRPGFLFVAIKGFKTDGHHFIHEAIKQGAVAIIGENDLKYTSVPYFQVDNSRKALSLVAKNFYRNPSRNKIMIGITGTNGKTTTSYFIKHILESAGKTCSLFGTIENIINGVSSKSLNTTPSSLILQQMLSESHDEVVIMEVSSHGLSQFRVDGIEFDFALFTNLDHEHLDYHKTMETYFNTKALLFDLLKPSGIAIINIDNRWGVRLVEQLQKKNKKTISIGQSVHSDTRLIQLNIRDSIVSIDDHGKTFELTSPIIGIHNLYNITMAYQIGRLLDVRKEDIIQYFRDFNGVKGRFESYRLPGGITVIVDYAHTQEAIQHCLTTIRQFDANRIFHIFGFRGNRDQDKRKDMIKTTSELSDQYILTFDDLNSVSESDMLQTLHYLQDHYGNAKGVIIPDRTLAIKWAIEEAQEGDWIIITGKGHEAYQQDFSLKTNSDKETIITIKHELEEKFRTINQMNVANQ